MRRIGTLNEGSLHADLKQWYSQLGDKHEVEVEGYIIDLVRSDLLIEIQTGNFSQVQTKLARLTERYPLYLVYPIAQTKWLCKEGSRRKSPKRGTWFHLFDQLVAIPDLLMRNNFSIEVALIEMEERRVSSTAHRKGWKVTGRYLLSVVDWIRIETPIQLTSMVLPALPDLFSTADLSKALKIPRRLAQRICYCLRQMGELIPLSKAGNAILYMRR